MGQYCTCEQHTASGNGLEMCHLHLLIFYSKCSMFVHQRKMAPFKCLGVCQQPWDTGAVAVVASFPEACRQAPVCSPLLCAVRWVHGV